MDICKSCIRNINNEHSTPDCSSYLSPAAFLKIENEGLYDINLCPLQLEKEQELNLQQTINYTPTTYTNPPSQVEMEELLNYTIRISNSRFDRVLACNKGLETRQKNNLLREQGLLPPTKNQMKKMLREQGLLPPTKTELDKMAKRERSRLKKLNR